MLTNYFSCYILLVSNIQNGFRPQQNRTKFFRLKFRFSRTLNINIISNNISAKLTKNYFSDYLKENHFGLSQNQVGFS